MDIIQTILDRANADYEFIFHDKQLYSATEGAEYFGIEAGQTAPTLIIKADKEYAAIIFSGKRDRLDLNELAALLKVAKVKLADKNQVFDITGFHPGDTPMIGLRLPVIFDKALLQYAYVYGGSGQANRTLKISPNDLVNLNHPIAFLEK